MPIIENSWDVRVSPITKTSQGMMGHQIPKIVEAHECHQLCEIHEAQEEYQCYFQ